MKKFFIIFTFVCNLFLTAKADVMPYYVNNINTGSIGVYQASNNIKVYKEPNVNSPLLLDVSWDSKAFNCADVSASNLFVVFLPKKDLAFLTVIDENDNEDWVEIAYNQGGSKLGWVKKDDDYKFMNWRSFFNIYGRKYGLYYMKDAPLDSKIIRSSNDEQSQQLGNITFPQTVNLTAVKGNWLLVVALDVERVQKIGWLKWRNISGEMYLFPDIK